MPVATKASSASRLYDVCVYGATGFTGRLASLYLATSYPTLRFAIAGRDVTKLKVLEAEINGLLSLTRTSSSSHVGVIAGSDLAFVAKSSKVVISTAGPFLSFGEELVKACVTERTHYCNITGEPLFFKLMEERYGKEAKENGVVLAMMCGFDSIPADLGTYLAIKKAKEELQASIESAKAYVFMRGSASGGTIATFFNSMKHPQRERERDPLFLNVSRDEESSASSSSSSASSVAITNDTVSFPRKSDLAPGYLDVPFIMSPINTRIVRRSASHFAQNVKDLYSTQNKLFAYSEVGLRSSSSSWKVWMGYILDSIQFFLLKWIPGFATFAQNNLVPKPGQGPSKEDIITKNYFHYLVVASTSESESSHPTRRVIVKMTGGDGGYADTAVMLVESGLCLALEFDKCIAHMKNMTGFHTPATAFGNVLVDRLNATKRVKFEYIKDTKHDIAMALEVKRDNGLKVAELGHRQK
jgi:short subunit dehydrogenase-like uncharacterized protein